MGHILKTKEQAYYCYERKWKNMEKSRAIELLNNVADYFCFREGVESAIDILSKDMGFSEEDLKTLGFTENDIKKYS